MSDGTAHRTGHVLVSVPYHEHPAASAFGRLVRRWWSNAALSGGTIACAVAAAAVQSWFKVGAFFAAGDVGPYLPLLGDVTRSWTTSLTGAGSSGYQSSNIIPAFVRWATTGVGLSETFAQRAYFTLVVVVAVAAMAYLAGGWVKSRTAVAAASLVVLLNPFHLTTLPNLLPLTTMASIAFVVGAATRLAVGRRVSPYVYIITGVWMSPVVRNPPLLVLFAAISAMSVVAAIVVGKVRGAMSLRPALVGALWLAAASLFWVIPVVLHYANGTEGLAIVAERNADAWSWTHRRSGPLAVVTLTASYFWGDPGVVEATALLDEQPWRYLRYGLPVCVALSFVVATRRRLVAAVGAVAFVSATISVGLNWPVRPLYRFLFENMPGFWLFRQPFTKFGVLLVVAYALMIALGVDGLLERVRTGRMKVAVGAVAGSFGAVAAIAAVAFAHPIYTGSLVPGDRPTMPSAHVVVPADWERAGKWLDVAPGEGAVLVLPLSEYYQRGTTWGYYGVDDLVSRVTSRPALFTLPGGYYEAAGISEELMHTAEDAIASGDVVAAQGAMRALGASYLLVRTDADPTWGFERRFRDGEMLLERAESMFSLKGGAEFEYLTIFEVGDDASNATGTTADRVVPFAEGVSQRRMADVVASLPSGTVAVGDSPTGAWAWVPDVREQVATFGNAAGEHTVSVRLHGPLLLEARVVPEGAGWKLEVANVSSMDVDDVALFDWSDTVMTSTRPVALSVGSSAVPLSAAPVRFEAEPGAEIGVFVEGAATSFTRDDVARVGNCNNAGNRPLVEAGITASLDEGTLTLRAERGAACVSTPVGPPTPVGGERLWVVRGTFDRTSGAATRLCLWLPADGLCAGGLATAFSERTATFDAVVHAPDDADVSGAGFFVYADADQSGVPAEASFSGVAVSTLAKAATVRVRDVPAEASTVLLASGETAALPDPSSLASMLGPFSTIADDCNRYDERPFASTGIAVRQGAGEMLPIELSADWHSACVAARIYGVEHLTALTVDFDYRNMRGGAGRWCVVAAATPGCVASGGLAPAPNWTRFTADIELERKTLTELEGGQWKLYLYADATGPGAPSANPTTVAYRRVSVVATHPVSFVAVPPAREQGVVVLRQSFGSQWSTDGAPASANHVVVDGWSNGWLVDAPAASDASFVYGPDRWTVLAALFLLVVVAAGEIERRLYRKGTI